MPKNLPRRATNFVFIFLLAVFAALCCSATAQAQQLAQVGISDNTGTSLQFTDAAQSTAGNCTPAVPPAKFNPVCATTEIFAGDNVQWNFNSKTTPHSTTSGSCPSGVCGHNITGVVWDSGAQTQAQEASFEPAAGTYSAAGVDSYFCSVHLFEMQGLVVVKDYSVSAPASVFTYINQTVNIGGTVSGLPNALEPAVFGGGQAPSYGDANDGNSVNFTCSGSARCNIGSVTPTLAGAALGATDKETVEGSPKITYSGTGTDPDTLKHSVQVTVNAVSLTDPGPGNMTVLTNNVGVASPSFNVTTKGVFPAGNVTLTCSGLPANVTCNFSTPSFTPSNSLTAKNTSETLTVTAASNAVDGNYPITIVATPGAGLGVAPATGAFRLTVNSKDFSVAMSSPLTQSTAPGTNVIFNGTVTPVGGYANTVTLSCVGNPNPLPSTCTPIPPTLTFTGNNVAQNFQISAGNSAGAAPFIFQIQGTDGTLTHLSPQNLTLTVGAFDLRNPQPASAPNATVVPGNPSTVISFDVHRIGTFSGTVSFGCSGIPAGTVCEFDPPSIAVTADDQTAHVYVDSGSAVAPGSYPFSVVGTSGTTSPQLALTLQANVGTGTADLRLSNGILTPPAGIDHNNTPDPVLAGQAVDFSLHVENEGPSTVTPIVTIVFSAPMTSVNSAQATCLMANSDPTTFTCTLPSQAAATVFTMDVIATPLTPLARLLGLSATVFSTAIDPSSGDNFNSDGAEIRVRPFARKGLTVIVP